MSAWLPIDSAPKDGSAVLLWIQYSDAPVVGYFRKYGTRQGAWYFDTENYEVSGDGCVVNEAGAIPTHWMPLPEPPQ